MLAEAAELQEKAVNQLCEKLYAKEELTFRAPTGSGKTHMMADLMDRVLEKEKDVVFLVSSLSKGDLARQNYEKFCQYSAGGEFSHIKPYLISSEIAGEEGLFIPTAFNVYLLPRDLYKQGGRLMQGAMESFLQNMTFTEAFGGKGKTFYLIKDECHIATNNLDNLSKTYFSKIINFSATPQLKRGQNPDVEISDDEAVQAKLIKHIELGDDSAMVADAIEKYESIKESYRNLLGVNPCLIIQISNKDKADFEWKNTILPELNKSEHQDLKWMLIVDDPKKCETNDVFKAKKIPVAKWKDYAKDNAAAIDIIIFKMVISEGWDIPRACMLYQIRDTQSKQLDEQVMGRVRRNPRLLDFETLSDEAQELAMTAWVWGIIPERGKKVFRVKLWDEPTDVTGVLRLKTTRLKRLDKKEGFDIGEYLSGQPKVDSYDNIFELYRKLKKSDHEIKELCYSYSDNIGKWFDFTEHLDGITAESNRFVCDYSQSMEIEKDDDGKDLLVSFPMESQYTDNGNYINITDWVWRRCDGQSKFAFDSEAEWAWASLMKDLVSEDSDGQKIGKRIQVGKRNPKAGNVTLFGEEPEKSETANKYLWGKNYPYNSAIKYEYCLGAVHSSYPDFIMQDRFDRIHLFEVKSVNIANATPAAFDSLEYKLKLEELKRCYKQASLLTGYIFYLPVLKDDEWHITRLQNGMEDSLTEKQFKDFMRMEP